jgi:hypothetical protein
MFDLGICTVLRVRKMISQGKAGSFIESRGRSRPELHNSRSAPGPREGIAQEDGALRLISDEYEMSLERKLSQGCAMQPSR